MRKQSDPDIGTIIDFGKTSRRRVVHKIASCQDHVLLRFDERSEVRVLIKCSAFRSPMIKRSFHARIMEKSYEMNAV